VVEIRITKYCTPRIFQVEILTFAKKFKGALCNVSDFTNNISPLLFTQVSFFLYMDHQFKVCSVRMRIDWLANEGRGGDRPPLAAWPAGRLQKAI
jgi:hypothetical protein